MINIVTKLTVVIMVFVLIVTMIYESKLLRGLMHVLYIQL